MICDVFAYLLGKLALCMAKEQQTCDKKIIFCEDDDCEMMM